MSRSPTPSRCLHRHQPLWTQKTRALFPLLVKHRAARNQVVFLRSGTSRVFTGSRKPFSALCPGHSGSVHAPLLRRPWVPCSRQIDWVAIACESCASSLLESPCTIMYLFPCGFPMQINVELYITLLGV